MSTTFIDIYARAMTNFDDPRLARMQQNDLYTFCTVMHEWLQSAIARYEPNIDTMSRIAIESRAINDVQLFTGDGVTTQFTITTTPLPTANSIFKVWVNNSVWKQGFSYDASTGVLTLGSAPSSNSSIRVCWYTDGAFSSAITNVDITMLALGIALSWAIKTSNKLLDIDRSLQDTGDFKQHAPGATQDAKVNWVKHFEELYYRELSKHDWKNLYRRNQK